VSHAEIAPPSFPLPPALFAILRFASPSLPIGTFAYSRGLEYAVHAGWITDEDTARDWILGLVSHSGVQLDGAVFTRLHAAFADGDATRSEHWNSFLMASRESSELRLEDSQLGAALMRLLGSAGVTRASGYAGREDVAYATAFALAMVEHQVPLEAALGALLWAQAESQTSAALRLVPLGQTSGQRILSRVIALLPELTARSLAVTDDAIGAFAPALALGSALHETQYTRLFRS
jgi:urease accessory protein